MLKHKAYINKEIIPWILMNFFVITDDQYIDEMEFDFAPWTEVDEVDLGTNNNK